MIKARGLFIFKIKLFLKNKSHGNPRACARRYADAYACSKPAYASFMHAYANTSMRTHARVLETMKGKFYTLKTEV